MGSKVALNASWDGERREFHSALPCKPSERNPVTILAPNLSFQQHRQGQRVSKTPQSLLAAPGSEFCKGIVPGLPLPTCCTPAGSLPKQKPKEKDLGN